MVRYKVVGVGVESKPCPFWAISVSSMCSTHVCVQSDGIFLPFCFYLNSTLKVGWYLKCRTSLMRTFLSFVAVIMTDNITVITASGYSTIEPSYSILISDLHNAERRMLDRAAVCTLSC